MNTSFKVIGLTRLGIKPEFTVPKKDALTIQPCEVLDTLFYRTVCKEPRRQGFQDIEVISAVRVSNKSDKLL